MIICDIYTPFQVCACYSWHVVIVRVSIIFNVIHDDARLVIPVVLNLVSLLSECVDHVVVVLLLEQSANFVELVVEMRHILLLFLSPGTSFCHSDDALQKVVVVQVVHVK